MAERRLVEFKSQQIADCRCPRATIQRSNSINSSRQGHADARDITTICDCIGVPWTMAYATRATTGDSLILALLSLSRGSVGRRGWRPAQTPPVPSRGMQIAELPDLGRDEAAAICRALHGRQLG